MYMKLIQVKMIYSLTVNSLIFIKSQAFIGCFHYIFVLMQCFTLLNLEECLFILIKSFAWKWEKLSCMYLTDN